MTAVTHIRPGDEVRLILRPKVPLTANMVARLQAAFDHWRKTDGAMLVLPHFDGGEATVVVTSADTPHVVAEG